VLFTTVLLIKNTRINFRAGPFDSLKVPSNELNFFINSFGLGVLTSLALNKINFLAGIFSVSAGAGKTYTLTCLFD